MNWSRSELKSRAKVAFRRNYWKCVIVAFIIAIITSKSTYRFHQDDSKEKNKDMYTREWYENRMGQENFNNMNDLYNQMYGEDFPVNPYNKDIEKDPTMIFLNKSKAMVAAVIGIALIVLTIFVFNPLQIAGCKFFIDNAESNSAHPLDLLNVFQYGYGNIVIAMLEKSLFVFLWSLLLIIPGIIKSYEYRMVPYILADFPEMERSKAFALSKRMMNGEKMNAFILDLSFIGWNILSELTFQLVGIFWSNPYQYATNAELYLALQRWEQHVAYENQ